MNYDFKHTGAKIIQLGAPQGDSSMKLSIDLSTINDNRDFEQRQGSMMEAR